MPYADRIKAVTAADRRAVTRWVQATSAYMAPAGADDIGLVINGLFEAYDLPPPSKFALPHWFEALGRYPLWVLEKAAGDTILESPHKPTIADVVKRADAAAAPHATLLMMARMILDYGQAPEPEEPVSDERRAEVREILAAAGMRRMTTEPTDGEEG